MGRHSDWCRIVFTPTSDPDLASALIPQGRLMLGQMIQGLQLVDQRTGTLRRAFPNNATITATFDGITPQILIDAPGTDDETPQAVTSNLWVPRGFVVYPAWNANPLGVGLPIIPASGVGPYDPSNLAPGVDPSRWTAGGPCGEILISPDTNAGYQSNDQAIQCPILSDLRKGPLFVWNGTGYYDAQASSGNWKSYRMEFAPFVAHYSDESVANCEALFEAVNTYRTGKGLKALNLMPRGLYHPAQVMVSIMQAAGASTPTSPAYPLTYATPADRLTKEGYGAEWQDQVFDTFNRGDSPLAFEFLQNGGAASDVLAGWLTDAGMTSQLETDEGYAAISDTGFRGGFWAFNLIERTHWIEAGNQGWQSSDSALPPLSWMGFASLNLAWETWPVTINPDPTTQPTQPFLPAVPFTAADSGDVWMRYLRSKTPGISDYEPAMSRHIFSRGRAIALAPGGGLVWGASIVANGDNDRLIALIHHPEDQPSDTNTNGCTRYLRVWWCDIPTRPQLRAAPQKTITGEDSTDTWGWKSGEMIDVGVMPAPSNGSPASGSPNALKMASQWRFSPDGTHAICLRDYAATADYAPIYDLGDSVYIVRAYFGAPPRAVELSFDVQPNAVVTSVTYHDYTAGNNQPGQLIAAPLDCDDTVSTPLYQYPVQADAVDYDTNGNIIYSFYGILDGYYADSYRYVYAGTGTAATVYASDLTNRALLGCQVKTTSQNLYPWTHQVADVATGVFAVEGGYPVKAYDGSNYSFPSVPCAPFTTTPVHGVRLYRAGALLGEAWYPAPDGLLFTWNTICSIEGSLEGIYIDLPLAMSRSLQLFYATRFGKELVSYQLSPMPNAAVYLESIPSGDICGCNVDLTKPIRLMQPTELLPRGGAMGANVPLPVADWLIYAKVV